MLKGISQEEGPKEFASIRSTVEHSDMVDVTRHSSKIDEKTRRNLVRDAAVSPISGYTGFLRYVTTISRILHMSGLWGRVARRKLFLTKKNIHGGITLFGAFGPFSSDGTEAFSSEQSQIPVSVGTKTSGKDEEHDNHLKQTSKSTKAWLRQKERQSTSSLQTKSDTAPQSSYSTHVNPDTLI